MVLVITQETYDEVVKENIEEFEMTPEEATKEAIAQFEAQGVDLTNIIKDLNIGSGDTHVVTAAINNLKKLGPESDDDQALLKELDILKSECRKDIARRMKAGKDGAYPVLINLLQTKMSALNAANVKSPDIILNVLQTLEALMDVQPDYLDDKGIDIMFRLLKENYGDEIKLATLKWTTICCIKHEMNRVRLFDRNIGDCLKDALTNHKLISDTLQVIRKFTLDDDIRVEFGKAPEHAKELGFLLLEPLTALLRQYTQPPLVSELLLTIASLIVRHELCSVVAQSGSDVLFTVLRDNYDNAAVVTQGNKLITALAGNDDVKRDLVKSGIVPILVSLLNRYSSNATTSAYTLKSISALCLREPAHGQLFLASGVAEPIVQCLLIHKENATVQKNGCWAIRNMVARCRDYNAKFRELGVEPLLKDALQRFGSDFGFDIKSALRDLECEVKLEEQWTGKRKEIDRE